MKKPDELKPDIDRCKKCQHLVGIYCDFDTARSVCWKFMKKQDDGSISVDWDHKTPVYCAMFEEKHENTE